MTTAIKSFRPSVRVLEQIVQVQCGRNAVLSGGTGRWRIEQPYKGGSGERHVFIPSDRVLRTEWDGADTVSRWLRVAIYSHDTHNKGWVACSDGSQSSHIPRTAPDFEQVRILCAIHNKTRELLETSQNLWPGLDVKNITIHEGIER